MIIENEIKVKRAYAWAKGIGRFSCDRLGRNLYLETVKDEPNSKTEALITDWEKFEGDIKDEFINVSVLHETVQEKRAPYCCISCRRSTGGSNYQFLHVRNSTDTKMESAYNLKHCQTVAFQ